MAWELCWGGRVQGSCGAVSLGRGCCQLTASPSPFCFLNLSTGCASCRNFSPSGWQPLQVPAWGWGGWQPWRRLKGRRTLGLLASRCMVMLTHPPLPPFPELIHGCYYSGKKKLSSSGQQQGFFSSAPTIVWPLVLKSASLASEPETKRNRICLYPAQQMVVVIAKALINPSGLRRVQSWLCRLHLLGSSPLPPSLNSEVGLAQVPAGPPAVATPECSVSPCVRAPTPKSSVWHRIWQSTPCCACFPPRALEAEGAFIRTLKWLLLVPWLQPSRGWRGRGGQWSFQIEVPGSGQARVWA